MKKLFENVNGNQFKLITESVDKKYELLREGIKKIFSSADGDISYKTLKNIGWGYIKEVGQATKRALQEARDLAPEFGYQDDEYGQKFVKSEEVHDETDMSNPSEKREVQIGNEIIKLLKADGSGRGVKGSVIIPSAEECLSIYELAKELVDLHTTKQ